MIDDHSPIHRGTHQMAGIPKFPQIASLIDELCFIPMLMFIMTNPSVDGQDHILMLQPHCFDVSLMCPSFFFRLCPGRSEAAARRQVRLGLH